MSKSIHSVVEDLAAIEHQRWTDWQAYVHGYCGEKREGYDGLYIPGKFVERWQKQIDTEYVDLSEADKEKDREQVRRYLPIITDLLSKERTDIVERIRNHTKQNTYEGEAAKVYKTTMAEVEEIIQSNN